MERARRASVEWRTKSNNQTLWRILRAEITQVDLTNKSIKRHSVLPDCADVFAKSRTRRSVIIRIRIIYHVPRPNGVKVKHSHAVTESCFESVVASRVRRGRYDADDGRD